MMRNEAEAGVKTRYKQETGIDITYGEKSWRPVQSVIDIIQNHIDAHAGDPRAETHLPSVRLRVSNGTDKKLVDYPAIHGLPEDWQIVGFRVSEKGAGFDRKLLSMMGASTKTDTETRGGLGEGLKMSITHLVRNGADVRTFSQNEDETWSAIPSAVDNTLQYAGRVWSGNRSGNSGSVTDVSFEGSAVPDALKEELSQVLDPRKGEGLGKYILDFRGPEFTGIAHFTKELTEDGVPPGRVYVKGLLVEERDDLLGSYNLRNKFAIAGRDRKKVKLEQLSKAIESHLQDLEDPSEIANLLRRIGASTKSTLEASAFSYHFSPSPQQLPLFRQAVEETYGFEPGVAVFARSIHPEDVRFANERGYGLVDLSLANANTLLHFFENLYPGEIVSLDQLKRDQPEAARSELRPNYKEQLDAMTTLFNDALSDAGIGRWIGNMEYEVAHNEEFRYGGKTFFYDPGRNKIIINPRARPSNFVLMADLWAELSKAAVGSRVFNVQTQDILTRLAGSAVAKIDPTLLAPLNLSVEQRSGLTGFEPYPSEQKRVDRLVVEFDDLAKRAEGFDLTQDEITQLQDRMHEIVNSVAGNNSGSNAIHYRGRSDNLYAFDDGIYEIRYGVHLRKIKTVKKASKSSRYILLPKGQAEYDLEFRATHYIPYDIKDGESVLLTMTQKETSSGVRIQRKGDRLIVFYINKDGVETLHDNQERHWAFEEGVRVYNNVLELRYEQPTKVTLQSTERQTPDQANEPNQGKDFIPSHMSIEYGKDVWMDPVRILLDAIQNHIDANGGKSPSVTFTVVDRDGEIRYVDEATLRKMPRHGIIGVNISDEGNGYPTSYLTTLGKTSKGAEDLGKFGEGLKLLSAACVQQGINVQLSSRDWIANPGSYIETVKDYGSGQDRAFAMLGYNMEWLDAPVQGSQTSFSLMALEPGQTNLSWRQLRELREKFGGPNYWRNWVNVLDPRIRGNNGKAGLDQYIAGRDEMDHSDGVISVLPDRGGAVYEKQLFVCSYPTIRPPLMFGYNVDATIINTRERNSIDQNEFNTRLEHYFKHLTDVDVMKKVLTTVRNDPNREYYEYRLLSRLFADSLSVPAVNGIQQAAWRIAYHEVFGENSILSLHPIWLDSRLSDDLETFLGRYSFSDSAVSRQIDKAIANEVHIDRSQLRVLPKEIAAFLSRAVTTSVDRQKAHDNQDLELLPSDKAVLMDFIRRANEKIIQLLEQAKTDKTRADYLKQIISAKALDYYMTRFQEIADEDVVVKNAEFPELGMVERTGGTGAKVSLNESILPDPVELLDTYVHEAGHFLSGERDYDLDFQRFLVLIALADIEPPAKRRGRR